MTFRDIIDWLKDIGSIIGILVTIFGVLAGIFKPIRKRFIAWLRKIVNTDEQDTDIKETRDAVKGLADLVMEHKENLDKRLDEIADQNTQLRNASYYTLGNVIREVYHENKVSRRLSEHDYDLCDKAYKLYHDEWKQNGPIQAMWYEMQTWEKIFG